MQGGTAGARCSWRRRVRWRLELLGWQALAACLWQLGHRRTLALGAAVGRLLPRISPRRLHVATTDLRRVFGDRKTAAEIDAIARRSLATLGATMAELLWLRRATRVDVAALVEVDQKARRALEEAAAHGRGVILIAIHFGRWELMFLGVNVTGHRFGLVTRPLENPYLDAYLSMIRCRFGNSVVHTGNARSMHTALANGETLLISIDHRSEGRRAAIVDFLGQTTALNSGIARLARRHDARLLPIHPLTLPDGRLRITLGPTLEHRAADTVEAITQRAANVFGDVIREHPEYWMWSHRRLWGQAPPSEPPDAQHAVEVAAVSGGAGA